MALIRIPTQTWQELDGVQEPFSIRRFRGVSTLDPYSLEAGYATKAANVSSANYPALSVRGGMTRLAEVNPYVRYQRSGNVVGVLVEESTTNLLGTDGVLDKDSNGDGVADGWSVSIVGGSPIIKREVVSNVVYPGFLRSQKIEVTPSVSGTSTVAVRRNFRMVLTPPYTTSVLIRVESLTGGAKAYVRVIGRRASSIQYDRKTYLTNPTDWVLVDIAETSIDVDEITIEAGLEIVGQSGGVIYVQAAQLESKPYRTSLTTGTRNKEELTVPTENILNLSQGTIEGFFTFRSSMHTTAGPFALLSHGTNPTSPYQNILGVRIASGAWELWVNDNSGQSPTIETWTNTLTDGRHHFAVRWDASEAALFLDGVKRISIPNPRLPQVLAENLYLGCWFGPAYQWNEVLDEVRISSKARSDQEIADAASAGSHVEDAHTTALFTFDHTVRGISPKGNVYATVTTYDPNGNKLYSSQDVTFGGLWVHKDDTILSIISGKVHRVYQDGTFDAAPLLTDLATDSVWSFCNFKGSFPDLCLLAADGNRTLKYDGQTIVDLPNAPSGLKYITAHANRVYGAVGQTLHFSALRKADDWTTAGDAGQIVVETDEGDDITAVRAGFGNVLIFKRYTMFELMGTGPENYRLTLVDDSVGCVANNSIAVLNGVMYWLGQDGIYQYTGGANPDKTFSLPVKGYIERITKGEEQRACAVSDGRRYYLAIPVDGSTDPNLMLEYDPTFNVWTVWELSSPIVALAVRKGDLYAGTKDARILKFDPTSTTDDGEAIRWYWESPPLGSGSYITRKRWYDMWLVVDLPVGSTLNAYLSPEPEGDDSWTLVRSLTASSDMQSVRIILPVQTIAHSHWARVRLEGTGPCKVHELAYRDRILPL